MNKRYYEHTLPIIRGSLSNTYIVTDPMAFAAVFSQVVIIPCDGSLRMGGEVQ